MGSSKLLTQAAIEIELCGCLQPHRQVPNHIPKKAQTQPDLILAISGRNNSKLELYIKNPRGIHWGRTAGVSSCFLSDLIWPVASYSGGTSKAHGQQGLDTHGKPTSIIGSCWKTTFLFKLNKVIGCGWSCKPGEADSMTGSLCHMLLHRWSEAPLGWWMVNVVIIVALGENWRRYSPLENTKNSIWTIRAITFKYKDRPQWQHPVTHQKQSVEIQLSKHTTVYMARWDSRSTKFLDALISKDVFVHPLPQFSKIKMKSQHGAQ